MKPAHRLRSLTFAAVAIVFFPARSAAGPLFAKQRLDPYFYAEGAAIADFNGDGHADVAAGPRVFAGPDFKTSKVYRSPHAFDRLSYSNNFLTYTDDFNADGRPDILVIGWPGKEAFWYENPGQGKPGDWQQHLAYFNVDTESPGFADVDGDGRADLVAGSGGRLGYMTRDAKDPKAPWTFHAISPPGKWQRYTHGVGLGDVNGDSRLDFLEVNGWWEQPASLAGDPVWTWFKLTRTSAGATWTPHLIDDDSGVGCQFPVTDLTGDGRPDIAIANKKGVFVFLQQKP